MPDGTKPLPVPMLTDLIISKSRDILLEAISQEIPQPSVTTISSKVTYRQISNINRPLAGNKIVDHSHVVGASPVGAAPTTSSFST